VVSNGRGGTEEEGDDDGDFSDIESDDSSNKPIVMLKMMTTRDEC
jgi:hypothetical protein